MGGGYLKGEPMVVLKCSLLPSYLSHLLNCQKSQAVQATQHVVLQNRKASSDS